MIPAVICPCISRFDLFERMCRSIDHPVERIVLIENSASGYEPPNDWQFDRLRIIRPIINIGYGGGINAAISQTPDAAWWLFVNADIAFRPGALAAIDEAMSGADEPRFVVTASANPFACGALNRQLVGLVGLFDEWTYYPAYYEDNDFAYRMKLLGLEQTVLPVTVMHGEADGPENASATIRSDPRYREANGRSFMENQRRYIEKWGGLPRHEVFTRPWDSDVPLSYTPVDLDGRVRRQW